MEGYTMKLLLVCLAGVLSCCEAYKILVVYTFPGKSHSLLGNGIVRHLLDAGHEVTYITAFPYEGTPKPRIIDVSDNRKIIPEEMLNIKMILNREIDELDQMIFMQLSSKITEATFSNKNVLNLLNDPNETFDAVIIEWMFAEMPSGLSVVFDCPLVWVVPTETHWTVLRLIDQPSNPAYTGDFWYSSVAPFTFSERVLEIYAQIKVYLMRYLYYDEVEKARYDNILAPIIAKRGRTVPSFYDVQFNASLMVGNTHVSLGPAISIPQNFIPIGGYHIDENVKPLPEDLKKILDNAKNGVIYFSMGSNFKSKDMPQELKVSLVQMFSTLKQTVLWKFEEDLLNKPKNVHILKWAPQQSILSHPNVVVFITHGGLLSTTETIHFGVPVIGIPVFGDQFLNVLRAVKRGFAVHVELSYNVADDLKLAIEEIITNPKYTKKAKELSFIYHDRPITPGKELAHWVRHVIETRGALHLRSPALNIPFYERLHLDLIAITLVIIFIIIKILKLICNRFSSKNSVKMAKKMN